MRWSAVPLLVGIIAWGCAARAAPVDDARALFDQIVRLGEEFDPAIVDLYADDALIKNTRRYPNGLVREVTFTVTQVRLLTIAAMPLARARGDTNTYSDVTFVEEGRGVRISGTRFSNLKQYSSPFSLLVAPNDAGVWLIVEDISESRP